MLKSAFHLTVHVEQTWEELVAHAESTNRFCRLPKNADLHQCLKSVLHTQRDCLAQSG